MTTDIYLSYFPEVLNRKVDVDLSNINSAGALALPSVHIIDLTIAQSDSTYTVPADGYFMQKVQKVKPVIRFYLRKILIVG